MGTPLYIPRGMLITDALAEYVSSYQHEIAANGGWTSATVSLTLSLSDAEIWFQSGINRHVEVYNPAQVVIWAGFVNQITMSIGTLQAIRGPLLDVANRVSVTYTPILDATTAPPLEGSNTTTTIANDATSQDLYGILEDVLSGGSLLDDGTTDDAAQMRDVYLQESRNPQTSEDINLSQSASVVVTLDLLGYIHRFSRYVYQDTTSATIQLDAKIQAVINGDPNGMFSTDFSRVDNNATLTSRYENTNRDALTILQECVSFGDATNARYTLGAYQGQQIVYAGPPTIAKYQHSILGGGIQIEDYYSHLAVAPWDILPAQWLFLTDFLLELGAAGTRQADPRFVFIESVRYSSPHNLQLNGQKVSSVPQLIARLAG